MSANSSDVLDQGGEGAQPSWARRGLAAVAVLAVSAYGISRLDSDDADEEPTAEVAAATSTPYAPWYDGSSDGDRLWQPIAEAPADVQDTWFFAASRTMLQDVRLGAGPDGRIAAHGADYAADPVLSASGRTFLVSGRPDDAAAPVLAAAPTSDGAAVSAELLGSAVAVGDPLSGGSSWWEIAEIAGGCTALRHGDDDAARAELGYDCRFEPAVAIADGGFAGRWPVEGGQASVGAILDRDGLLEILTGRLLASSPWAVVTWAGETSPLVVRDVVSGHDVEVPLPPGRVPRRVDLDPTGRFVSVVLVENLAGRLAQEVWVHDLAADDARMVLATTPSDHRVVAMSWAGPTLVVAGEVVWAYDARDGRLYRTDVVPMASRSDVLAWQDWRHAGG